MPTFKGTHGTSASRGNLIFFHGFQPTVVGRAGRGVYLWQYHEQLTMARDLAIGWFEAQNRRNAYTEEKVPKCAIIYGSIDVDESDVLDCDGEILEQIYEILWNLNSFNDIDIHTAYEYVINAIEKKRGLPVILVKASVSPPARMSFKAHHVIGNPVVIVVRERLDKIVISKVEAV